MASTSASHPILTPEIIAELRIEFQTVRHRSYTQLADAFGMTKGAVIGRLTRAGIRSPKAPNARMADYTFGEIEHAVRHFSTLREAAKSLHVSATTLSLHCVKLGIRTKQAPAPTKPRHAAQGPRWNGSFRRQSKVVNTPAETARMVEEAIAKGRLTKCPPGYAMGSTSMIWERIL